MTDASFQWDPHSDQTYNEDNDLPLTGSAASFNKDPGKSFTMDAPGRTLTLLTSFGDGKTEWGGLATSTATPPTIFNIANGTLVYDGAQQHALYMSQNPQSTMQFTVQNQAQFRLQNAAGALFEWPLTINITQNGSFEIFDTEGLVLEGSDTHITLTDAAKMSARVRNVMQLGWTQIDVSTSSASSPNGAYALDLAAGSRLITYKAKLNFSAASMVRISAASLQMDEETLISASESAVSHFQFDASSTPPPAEGSGYVLGPGSARMRFDGYSGNNPFDIPNKDYWPKLFTIVSNGTVNGGKIMIQNPIGDAGVAFMLQQGLIAIDDEIQTGTSRLNITNDSQGYTHISQKN
ncbi:hypothetical protein ATN84_01590 [Paramesorhizobium deserti]|uniref:Uncharacterized protein n=1 Tax=Paramesorhizobium deserti TaxID=1494590 RepID=A0A135HZC3_9HYPH|nr:hypothetical protein [Paramesorhizobium deserti]KXF78513.1 hypothetical protein ATN84_01590 [Paramesorhizobium deserti]